MTDFFTPKRDFFSSKRDFFSPRRDFFSPRKGGELVGKIPEWYKPASSPPENIPQKPKQEKSAGKLALSIAEDLVFMAVGEILLEGIGGIVVAGVRGAKTIENAATLAKIIFKGSKVVGGTAGLATSSLIQGEKPKEAVQGAIAAQVLGYGIAKVGKYAVGKIKAITPEPVKQSVKDVYDKTYNWLFHGGNARPEDIKDIHKELLSVINLGNTVRRKAEEELGKLINNPQDIRELTGIIEKKVIDNPNIIPNLPQEKALNVLKVIKNLPINKYSAEPHFLFELAKLPEIEQAAKHILEKYPTLAKYDDLYKYSTEAYYKLIEDKIGPEALKQVKKEVAEVWQRSFAKVKSLEEMTTALAKGEKIGPRIVFRDYVHEKVGSDAFKNELRETKQLIKTLEELRDKKLLEDTKSATKIISEFKKIVKQLERVRVPEIREAQKISKVLTQSISDLENIAAEFPKEINISPIKEEITKAIASIGNVSKIVDKEVIIAPLKNVIREIDYLLDVIPNKTLKAPSISRILSYGDSDVKRYFISTITRERISFIKKELEKSIKDTSPLGKERTKFLKNQLKNLIKAENEKIKELLPLQKRLRSLKQETNKAIRHLSKLGIVTRGLLKQQERDLTLKNLEKLRDLLPSLMPRDIKSMIEKVHNMYYSRTGLPAKIGLKKGDTVTSPFEYQIEKITSEVLGSFNNYLNSVAGYLKERRYSTLIAKYADDILTKVGGEAGYRIEYKSNRDFADVVTNTHIIPIAIDRIKKLVTKWISEGKCIETEIKGFSGLTTGSARKFLVPYAARTQEEMVNGLAKLNGLAEENAAKLFSALSSQRLIGQFPELGIMVHKDIYELLGHSIRPLFAGKMMLFDSSKDMMGVILGANTLFKRIQMLFGIIHYKALTTAAIGTGRTKELGKAWESVFRSDDWFKEHVLPMQKEIVDLFEKHNLKTTFFLSSFDDVREQFERMMLQDKLNPLIKLAGKVVNKTGLTWLSAEFDKRLWDRMFYTLKCMSARNILAEMEKGNITKETAESFLNKLGSAFGGNYEWLFMRRIARNAARFLFFAPDWYLTMIRHLTGAVSGHELFSDFFRRIFLLHYALANEMSWQLTGKTTWERFQETHNWEDLFRVPLISVDPQTGKYKRSNINLLGFETEGLELLGFIPMFDFLYEYSTTNKSAREAAGDAAVKWSKHVANKKGPLANSIYELFRSMGAGEGLSLLKAAPLPIIASTFNLMFNRNVTFTEAGDRVPAGLLATLYQTGIKFRTEMELSKYYRIEMRKKVTPEEAKVIIDRAYNDIEVVTDKVRAVEVPAKLSSDNPKTWFYNMMKSTIMEDLNDNYKSDINEIVKGRLSAGELEQKIFEDFEGTAISYHPAFRKYVSSALRTLINKHYQKYRREHAGEE